MSGLPEVDPELCVHGIVVNASCRACVDSCPTSAWVLDEDALGLDPSACDGCGICVGACPQSAISFPRPALAVSPNERHTALLACELSVPSRGKGVLPCVHAVNLDELALLYKRGVTHLLVSRADCGSCKRGPSRAFETAVANLRQLLRDRGLQKLSVKEVPGKAWTDLREEYLRHTRRSLFMSLRAGQNQPLPPANEIKPAANSLAYSGSAPVLHPILPRIDPEICEACDACSEICTPGAIRRISTDTATARYDVEPAYCTGCRLCIDVCEVDAVSLLEWTSEPSEHVDLDSRQCKSCGNPYWIVSDRSNPGGLCRICSHKDHNRLLFQVLK